MANFKLLVSTGLIFSLFFVAQLADAIKEPSQINEFEQVNQVNLLNGECLFCLSNLCIFLSTFFVVCLFFGLIFVWTFCTNSICQIGHCFKFFFET